MHVQKGERFKVKQTMQKAVLLLVALTQVGAPAFAIDDGQKLMRDEVPVMDLPASFPKSQLAVPTELEMGGFVFDNRHGKGPDRDDPALVLKAREEERDREANRVLKINGNVKAVIWES
jgi:hypothetical protein